MAENPQVFITVDEQCRANEHNFVPLRWLGNLVDQVYCTKCGTARRLRLPPEVPDLTIKAKRKK